MRIMGIDYGTKKIGIAMSDEAEQFAMPVLVINNSKQSIEEIVSTAKKNNVTKIVLGESKNYKGEANKIMVDSLKFKEKLEESGYKVIMEPEFMTSAHAQKFMGKSDLLDASAAALILQSHLDKAKFSA